MKYVHSVLIAILMLGLAPSVMTAETNLVDEVVDFTKGTAGVKTVKDIDGNLVGDVVIEHLVGDIPSTVMTGLLEQVREDFNDHSKIEKIRQNHSISYNQCQQAANARVWGVLGDLRDKGKLAIWVEISWNAMKGIASGGSTVTELIVSHTKSKLQEQIKDWLNTSSTLPKETVTVKSIANCEAESVVVWDPQNKLLTIDVKGNCGCETVRTGSGGKIVLNNYHVHIETKVTVTEVKIDESWFGAPRIKAQYKIGTLHVDTIAECNRQCPRDGSETESESLGLIGWITGIFDWVTGSEDGHEDEDDEVEDDNGEGSGTVDDGSFISGIADAFVGMFGGGESEDDGTTEEEDTSDDNDSSEEPADDTQPLRTTETKPLQCGEAISIDGRTAVPTYKTVVTDNGLYSCNNTCGLHQLCQSVADQSIVSGSCTYCKNVCDKGQFRHEFDCNESKGVGQECLVVGSRAGGKCYGIKGAEKKEEISPKTESVTCVLPSDQAWNNVIMYGFKYTVLDEKRVRVENDRPYCGMDSLAEFQKTADATLRFFSCPSITTSEFVYSDIRGACSFIAQFGD